MIIRDISFNDPVDNILYDDVLLECAEKGFSGEMLRFWESPVYFIVLGRIGKTEEDLVTEAIKADNIPVARRSSGGGTVLQGPGCLNYSLVLSKARASGLGDITKSYEYVLSRVVRVLEGCGVRAAYYPISDIALIENEKKFSGNAQCRRRGFFLHHGTILYNFDLELIGKYLRMPQSVPDYRRGRAHGSFIANIDIDIKGFKKGLADAFQREDEINNVLTQERDLLYDKNRAGKTILHL